MQAGRPVAVGRQPVAVAIAPDGRLALVANYEDGSVTPLALPAVTAGAPVAAGPEPISVVITPNSAAALVADFETSQVTPIDLAVLRPAQAVALRGEPDGTSPLWRGHTTAWVSAGGRRGADRPGDAPGGHPLPDRQRGPGPGPRDAGAGPPGWARATGPWCRWTWPPAGPVRAVTVGGPAHRGGRPAGAGRLTTPSAYAGVPPSGPWRSRTTEGERPAHGEPQRPVEPDGRGVGRRGVEERHLAPVEDARRHLEDQAPGQALPAVVGVGGHRARSRRGPAGAGAPRPWPPGGPGAGRPGSRRTRPSGAGRARAVPPPPGRAWPARRRRRAGRARRRPGGSRPRPRTSRPPRRPIIWTPSMRTVHRPPRRGGGGSPASDTSPPGPTHGGQVLPRLRGRPSARPPKGATAGSNRAARAVDRPRPRCGPGERAEKTGLSRTCSRAARVRGLDRPPVWPGGGRSPAGARRGRRGRAGTILDGPLAHREEQGTFNPKVARSRLARPTKCPVQTDFLANSYWLDFGS